jgi:Flp pilus assembly protein TadG
MLQPSEALMRRRRNQRGQALIESGLIMVIFLSMLIGILDFGQFLYFHQSLSERARAAVRYGAIHANNGNLATDIANFAVYNDPAGTANGATAILPSLTTNMVSATLANTGTEDAIISVQINNYPFNFLSPFMSKSTWYKTIRASQPYESN